MNSCKSAFLRFLVLILIGTGFITCWPAVKGSDNEKPTVKVHPPAARLQLQPGEHKGEGAALLDPSAKPWQDAPSLAVLLNRTPRIFQTEPPISQQPPSLQVRALRAGGKLYLWLRWQDEAKDAPAAPPPKTGEGGMPDLLYKRPTTATSQFADAAAIMLPQEWKGPAFPSLQMGSTDQPVTMYYWNAGRGAEEMIATGRATPKPTGKSFRHQAQHTDGHWDLTLELPGHPESVPMAFALWDGSIGDRNGQKSFSIWYLLIGR